MNAQNLQQQWNAFIKQGLPTKRDERWKYSDLTFLAKTNFSLSKRMKTDCLHEQIKQHRLAESILLVFVNGYFVPSLSEMNKLPEETLVCSLNDATVKPLDLVKHKENPFVGINVLMPTDGLFLSIPDNCEVTAPIHLLSIATAEDEFVAHTQHSIVLGNNSKLILLEEYVAFSTQAYMTNVVTNIVIGNNAKLTHVKIQNESTQAVHVANTFITQKKDSNVEFSNFSKGSVFARDDVAIELQESGADCRTAGFYHLQQDNQYIDNHIDITHAAPRSNSEMLYKGIIDKKSRAVFNGKLYVAKDAQKILAYQANHNLLLSNSAEVYSKPELEIYADDVKCKHGATTGQIDQDALFYLRARGIDKTEAMNILLHGFAEEIMQRVTHPEIKKHIQERVS